MKKSVEILGLPIISITEGRELGVSKTLLIDAKNGVVAAITIEDEDWYRGVKLIPYEAVIAIGEDAVTITHSENILNLDEAGDYERLLVENIRVIGTKAITKTGRIQGNITEVIIGDGGKIEQCEITTPTGEVNLVNAAQISIFGKQVTVVDIDGEKKNNSVTETPTFEPTFEAFHEEPAQEVWTPAVEETPAETVEALPEVFDNPAESVDVPEVLDTPAETVEPESFDVPAETVEAATDIVEPPVEMPATSAEVLETPTEIFDIPTEQPPVEEPKEEVAPPEPVIEEPPVVEEPPVAEEQPKVEPPAEPQPSEEDQKLATVTQQAEALKKALKEARSGGKNQSKNPPKQADVDRRRRVLLGKHATKTITAESGTVVVEAGAEVTEEVLQRARLSNKFIELSMNVQ